jgi:hypothetical protein
MELIGYNLLFQQTVAPAKPDQAGGILPACGSLLVKTDAVTLEDI